MTPDVLGFEGRMKVFLSHSDNDKVAARKVADSMRKAGLDVWDESSEILPGDNWAEKVGQALSEAEAMVVLLSPSALQSDAVRWEIEYALGQPRYNRRLVSVLLRSKEKLPQDQIPWILKHLKMVELHDVDKAEEVEKITEALLEGKQK